MVVKPPSRRKKDKDPPIFTHDWFIVNHGDLFAGVLLLVFAGSMISWSPAIGFSNMLLFLNYEKNITDESGDILQREAFSTGFLDYLQAVFYVNGFIVVHCIYQEYLIDKVIKRLRNASNKLRQSTQDAFHGWLWHATNSFFAFRLVMESPINWFQTADYPFNFQLPFNVKMFFICQFAYWLHNIPELYLSRAKKEQFIPVIKMSCLYLIALGIAYETYTWKLAILLTLFDSAGKSVFHLARLFKYYDYDLKDHFFKIWNVLGILSSTTGLLCGIKFFLLNEWPNEYGKLKLPGITLVAALELYSLYLFTNAYQRYQKTLPTSSSSSSKKLTSASPKNNKPGGVYQPHLKKKKN